MDRPVSAEKKPSRGAVPYGKLMVSGWIHPAGAGIAIEIQRGMAILSREGQVIGKVAALVVKEEAEQVEEILLSRLPEVQGYWRVPVERIQGVAAGGVQLDLPYREAGRLKVWHAD